MPAQFSIKYIRLWIIVILFLARWGQGATPTLPSTDATLWTNGVGDGFQSGIKTLTLEVGGDYGVVALGSRDSHDIGVISLAYGRMLGSRVGGDHWYRGNWEGRLELFGGSQFFPSDDWLVGLTPHLRYNLATGTRWVPFIDAGAGVTATQIGLPDLSSTFEFNLQAGIGVHWFIKDNLALTAEGRFLHLSDAGISHPNYGVNGVAMMMGLTWLF